MGKRKHKAPQMPAWFWYGIVDGCWCCKNRHNCNSVKKSVNTASSIFHPKKKVGMAKPIMMIEENNHESNKAIQ